MHNFEDENCGRGAKASFFWHEGLKVLRTRTGRTRSRIPAGNLTTVNELHDSG